MTRRSRSILALLLILVLDTLYVVWPDFRTWVDTRLPGIDSSTVTQPVSVAPDIVRVTRVLDGDTFEIEGGEKVRLIGVDAPESVKPASPVECLGKEASARLTTLIEGKALRLEKDKSDRDRYGRLLRYAFLEETFINAELVREGLAWAKGYRPDIMRQETLRMAEQEARTAKRGLWDPQACPLDQNY